MSSLRPSHPIAFALALAALVLLLGAPGAGAEVFAVNVDIEGGGLVHGFIETDGTLGELETDSGAVVDWALTLTNYNPDPDSEVTLTGPLSGDNSVYESENLATQFLEATSNTIFFRFTNDPIGGVVRFCSGEACSPITPDWILENENNTPGGTIRLRVGTPDAEKFITTAQNFTVGTLAIFVDGFESNGTQRWSQTTP